MDLSYLSPAINLLLIVAFIVDRLFRLKSIKEYKDAKEAQIEMLKQQLEIEKSNNDTIITEMHKKRYESLKIILDEKETEISKSKNVLLELQSLLENVTKEVDLKAKLNETLLKELNRAEKNKHDLEIAKIELIEKAKDAVATAMKYQSLRTTVNHRFDVAEEWERLAEIEKQKYKE